MIGINALIFFVVILYIWRSIYVNSGNISFWQLTSNHPDLAFEWMNSNDDWVILKNDDPQIKEYKCNGEFTGPFKLYVPCITSTITIFAKMNNIDKSQDDFIVKFGSNHDISNFSWISFISLLYPIFAIFSIAKEGAPFFPTLGYGLANLGYLVFAFGLFVGRFKILGLNYRVPTIIFAVVIWIMGTVLSYF